MKKSNYAYNKRNYRYDGWLWCRGDYFKSYGPWQPSWPINVYHLDNYGVRHKIMNEKRQNINARNEEDIRYYKVKIRGKRCNIPSKWDDEYIARSHGKSWKDFTKAKKQYNKNK